MHELSAVPSLWTHTAVIYPLTSEACPHTFTSHLTSMNSMATTINTRRRRALGPRDVNVFTSRLTPPKKFDVSHERLRKDCGELPRKHSLDFLDDEQVPKAARYIGVPGKRVGTEHWLEDGVVGSSPSCPPKDDTSRLHVDRDPHLTSDAQETLLDFGEEDSEGGERLGLSALAHGGNLKPLRPRDDPGPSASTSFSSSAAAMALRLRLRVALFKVQTNQTAIPISHLQLPETSPQPLSVFPPSLVRVSNAHNEYYDLYDDDDDDETTTAPPSSPPPLTAAAAPYDDRGIPFLRPMESSSPSPKHGKPLDFGSSSVVHGESSPAHN